MKFFQRLPIARKILLGMFPVFLLLITGNVLLENHLHEKDMMEEAQKAAIIQAAVIKESMVSMMVSNLRVDTTFVRRLSEELDGVQILVNDLHLRPEVIDSAAPGGLHLREAVIETDGVSRAVLDGRGPVFGRDGEIFRAVVPFQATRKCQECHAVPVGYALGAADIRVSFAHVSAAARENWKRAAVIFIVFSGLGILVATLLFSRFVGKPIDRLVHATAEMSGGQPGSGTGEAADDPGLRRSDELMYLSGKFEQMRNVLREKINQLDEANRKLSARNAEIEDALARLRRTQEELVRSERLAVAGRMTAHLSHEINNPIHNIASLLETSLRKLPPGSEVRELVAIAQEEVTRMAHLTRQMLDFSRDDGSQWDRIRIDMGSLLDEISQMYRKRFEEQRIRFDVFIDPSVPAVNGSRTKLKQVFQNLLNNASDAITPPGSISLSASVKGETMEISVTDTGRGIPHDQLGKIFDPFFTTKREVSGVGLGLFVSYGILQQHGGTIRVVSEPSRGTTFTVVLPVPKSAEVLSNG